MMTASTYFLELATKRRKPIILAMHEIMKYLTDSLLLYVPITLTRPTLLTDQNTEKITIIIYTL